MTPELSEFSYGFALTHEIANFAGAGLKVAPIFPSLIEEGKAGGGYDVHLDWSGVPIFLQFKRANCLVRKSARQIQLGLPLTIPFYRFSIIEHSHSAQHSLLLSLDADPNNVFYVAPRFHLVSELNHAYETQTVSTRSFYIRPRDIGILSNEPHCIAFDTAHHFVCSEPRQIPAIDGQGLRHFFNERLQTDERPLRILLDKALFSVEQTLGEANISAPELDFGRPDKTIEERKLRRIRSV